MTDPVNHPPHYTSHPSGVECIDVVEHMNFNLGNVVKYVWRAGLKSPDAIQDLEKAVFYLEREIARLRRPTDRQALDVLRDPADDKDRRIADLIEANNALLERARVAEEAVRSGSHREVYAQLDRLTALADVDITGSGEARVSGTIERLRARVAELEEKLKAVSWQLSARGAP